MSKNKSSHGLSRGEMRASLLLPIGIIIAIWLGGLALVLLFPDAADFNTAVSITIGLSLIVFLLYWTRQANGRLRLTALLMAIPALVGITLGLTNGRLRFIMLGVGLTFLLLILQRLFDTPISFRTASSYFNRGDLDNALRIINKSIDSRPDFWESYQLRALIRLANLDFNRAEADAKQAIAIHPKAHPVLNTLGQIYLAQESFANAEKTYAAAAELAPDVALYHYHLGLSRFRQKKHQSAAEALATSTQKTLPTIRYDLQAHYYLGKSLERLGDKKTAAEAFAGMENFKDGLEILEEQMASQADYPHIEQLRRDADDIAKQLAKNEA
ncbi:MAG: tetratricopeptide repeat protein [Chloroflexota bacterium]